MERFDRGALSAAMGQIFNDEELNFDPAISSQGRAAASPAVMLSALKTGDSVAIDAPEGSPWAWMNGKALTVRSFHGGSVWCDCWDKEQGAFVRKDFLVPPELLRRLSK